MYGQKDQHLVTTVPIPVKNILDAAEKVEKHLEEVRVKEHQNNIKRILAESGEPKSKIYHWPDLLEKTDDPWGAFCVYYGFSVPDFAWEKYLGKRWKRFYSDKEELIIETKEDIRDYKTYHKYLSYPNYRSRGFSPFSVNYFRTEEVVRSLGNSVRVVAEKAKQAQHIGLTEVHVDKDLYNGFLRECSHYVPGFKEEPPGTSSKGSNLT